MTLGWIREDALDAVAENTEVVPPPRIIPLTLRCPFCDREFDTNAGLSHHLGSSHRAERPILLVGGGEPSRDDTIRSAGNILGITAENCTRIVVSIDGAARHEIAHDEMNRWLGGLLDATVVIALENTFDRRAAPIRSDYRLRIRIPDKDQLDAVDLAFRQHLATDDPGLASLRAFVEDPRCDGNVIQEYVEALADYIRGALAKDRPTGSNISLRQAEYRDLYIRAETRLRDYGRALPRLIGGLVRFALNDLTQVDPTGFTPLDDLAGRIGHLIDGGSLMPVLGGPTSKPSRALDICPVDHGVSRVLELARSLDTTKRWGPALSDECRQAAESNVLQLADRQKIMVLWANAAMRLRAPDEAVEPLQMIGNSYPFDKWAETMLTKLTP